MWVIIIRQWNISPSLLKNEEIKVRIARRAMEEKVQPAVSSSKRCSTAPSAPSSHSPSSALCRRLKLQLKRDEWLAEASAVKQRRVSEERESKLRKEKELVKTLTALAATDPKFNILTEFKGLSATSSSRDGTNPSLKDLPDAEQTTSSVPAADRRAAQSHDVPQNVQNSSTATTETMCFCCSTQIKRQTLLTLPSLLIPVFNGDPLKYRCFIREFKHFVEYKTGCNTERLRYMLQFTGGKPKQLVRSCLHVEPEYGYYKAKRLLKEHYGKPHKISAAYINKALNWPSMKSVDGRALLSFGLFLKECRCVMTDMRRTQELDCAPFMQAVFAKLPYRLRDYWGSKVRGIKKEEKRAAKFSDLVDFVIRHAEIALDPAYGYLLDSSSKSQRKSDDSGRSRRRSGGRRRFTSHREDAPKMELTVSGNSICPFSKPCLDCRDGEHATERCKKMRRPPHKGRSASYE